MLATDCGVLMPDTSISRKGNVKYPLSVFGTHGYKHHVPNGFRDRFIALMGKQTVEEFAQRSGTSKAAIGKARAGLDVATVHLEKWAKAFDLDENEVKEFVELGIEAEALMDKKRGHLYRRMREQLAQAQADRAEIRGLLREMLTLLEEPPNRLSQQTLEILRVLKKRL